MRIWAALVLGLVAVGCGGGAGDDAPAVDAGAGAADAVVDAGPRQAEVLRTGSIMVGMQAVAYELVRVPRADGKSVYVQWVHALEAGRRSVVVQTQPYEGIDWSGEAVDAQFKAATARPDGRYPDVACPEAAAASEGVAYALSAPDAMASATVGWLLNGHAVMLVYGRYYACDDLDGDIADMRAALGYLTTRADADPQHVAITGNSWGGFLALFGAVNAPPGLHLDAVVPMNPPSDFVDWLSYLDELATTWPRPADLAFFLSYKRRVLRASGGAPGVGDFTRFRHAAVCAGLGATPTLLLHDEWDTLIPIRQSQGLVTTCSRDGMWWPRQGTLDPLVVGLDHGLLGKEPGYPSVFTFAQVYLLARLNDAQHPIIALASRPAIASYLGLIHAEQVAGGQLGHALARLREAAGARIFFYIVDEMQTVEAAAMLAQGINTHWNTSYTAASLRTQLALGLPPL